MRPRIPPTPMARALGAKGRQTDKLHVACFTMGTSLYVEKWLERRTLLALDVDPRVKYIASQPFTARLDVPAIYATQSEARKAAPSRATRDDDEESVEYVYTPDFLVEAHDPVKIVIESKTEEMLAQLEAVMDRRRTVLKRLGYRLLTVTDRDVGDAGLDRNLVFMRDALKLLRDGETQSELDALSRAVADRSEPFARGLLGSQVSNVSVQLGLACGLIGCDLRQGALGRDTLIWPAHGDLAHLRLLDLGV